MRLQISMLVIATALTACGSPVSPERKAQIKTNRAQNAAALETAKIVQVNGKSFRVAHVTERSQSLVKPTGQSTPYFAAEVEAASRAATGCAGKFAPGILAFVGGDIASADLRELSEKISGDFLGWSVRVSC